MPFVFLAIVGLIIVFFGKPGSAEETGTLNAWAINFKWMSQRCGRRHCLAKEGSEIQSVDIDESVQLAIHVSDT